jgi:hypothetical protein
MALFRAFIALNFNYDADPDPASPNDADPDPASQSDADPRLLVRKYGLPGREW